VLPGAKVRLPRVGHGLRRLVVIGSDGMVFSRRARWLADRRCLVMLDRWRSFSRLRVLCANRLLGYGARNPSLMVLERDYESRLS